MEAFHSAALLMVWCVLGQSEPNCDQTEFLHPNGTCVSCPVCGPGEQLSEDCGFGDGGRGVCTLCEKGTFSTDTDVAPCKRCTQCNRLNRLETAVCSPTTDAQCGQCLPGYYELRSITGEVELLCVPCYTRDTVHKECFGLTTHGSKEEIAVGNFKEPNEKRVKGETFSMVLIGPATASLVFLIALLLWVFLLTAETFKQVPEYFPGPEGLFSEADLQLPCLSSTKPSELTSQTPALAEDSQRCLSSLSHEIEVHLASFVINVTTNVKPSGQERGSSHISQEEQQLSSCSSTEEQMERKPQKIWEMAQGQGIETLDYDSVKDLSLLLDAADNRDLLRRLGRSLGVPPQVIDHLRGLQDLFQYLHTSAYTLLPQLAQAAALPFNPEVVARIHQAVANQ